MLEKSFNRPSRAERVFNHLFGILIGLGLGLSHNYLLQVRGRKTGRLHSTPVNVLVYNGKRYLVAGRGLTQWVRNAHASGEITLKKGARSRLFRVRALPDSEKHAVLKAYLDRFRRTVQRYFPVTAGSPLEDFEPYVARYPVFEIVEAD
ncbi:MAG: nitroreductase/quinone reductase family protein [Myxococcales bacterium]|nr:nitroreductase/quinone reductase family protein [Myxococcales bacterium]MDH5307269.1 nitroreductase/quinone reductase family protein [Myxococcales bacterium]MDH5567274.1 nitroreductase/quinone reductase family protein [Myxococcales bacterium]